MSFSTAGVPVGRRVGMFREAVCDSFFDVDLAAAGDGPFDAELTTLQSSPGSVSLVRARPTRLMRSPKRLRPPSEERAVILHQIRGTGLIVQGGVTAEIEVGDIVCYVSSRPYELLERDDFCVATVMVPLDLMLQRSGRTSWGSARVIPGSSPMGAVAGSFLREIATVLPAVAPATVERLLGVSLDLVTATLLETEPVGGERRWSRSSLILRARALIDRELGDPDLSTGHVAAALGVSGRYLQAIFREEGTTVSAWIWERRLDRAHRDLADPRFASQSISSVAFACGFSDFTHFSHRFKARYGLCPRAFRAASR